MGKEKDKLPDSCSVCTYHIASTKECRRHNPHPSQDEGLIIAAWNFSRDHERCGAGSTIKQMIRCEDCVHWYQPGGKPLDPPFRQGLSREWWGQSGHCIRSAPGATIEEGQWTSWRVTNGQTGGCGDGVSAAETLEAADT